MKKPDNIYSEIEVMERSQLEALQLRLLKTQLNRCYEFSPFYQQKFKDAGYLPGDFRALEDIRNLPFTYKQQLRDSQSRVPPWGDLLLRNANNWTEVHTSTGIVDSPFYTLWSLQDIENITDYVTRMLFGIGIRNGDIFHVAYQFGLRMGGMSVKRVAEKMDCSVLPIGDGQIQTQIEMLLNFRPNILFAMPAFAFLLAEKLQERGIDPEMTSMKIGCFSGEAGIQVPTTRARLERLLGLKAYDFYGLTEIGPLIAAECEQRNGLHWAEDYHLIEIIDPETLKPCQPGEAGVIVITDLKRDLMPVIRYWTNDIAMLDYKPCACGRTHAKSIGGILGTAEDMAVSKGIKIFPAQIESILSSYDELGNEFKVYLQRNDQTGAEYCLIKVESISGQGIKHIRSRLEKELCAELKTEVKVEFIPFGMLERNFVKVRRVER